jgi:uncharacterized membrane protein
MLPADFGAEGSGRPPTAEGTPAPAQPGAIVLAVLAVLGLGVAGYLTSVHYAHTPLACSSSGTIDCAKVLSSVYSLVPGTSIPVTLPGIGFFLISLALALAQLWRPFNYGLRQAHAAWAGLGMLTVLYLVFVELVELRVICLWCTSFHVIILITLLMTLWRLYPQDRALSRP